MSRPPSASGLYRADIPVTDWATVRKWVLDRDSHKCRQCGVNIANEVDHIWPRRLGGTDHIDNLRAICGPCNKAKGGRVPFWGGTDEQLHTACEVLEKRIQQIEIELNEVQLEIAGRAFEHGKPYWAALMVASSVSHLETRRLRLSRLRQFGQLSAAAQSVVVRGETPGGDAA